MNSRYNVLNKSDGILYATKSPLVIIASALSKDTVNGKVFAQIKFQNISNKTIISVIIDIEAKDVFGKSLESINDFQYLDINAARNGMFGANIAVYFPDEKTRSFSILVKAVLFSDGSKWDANGKSIWEIIPVKSLNEILIENDLISQYKTETTQDAKYAPTEHDNIWICTCGGINDDIELTCSICHQNKEKIFDLLNKDKLKKIIEYNNQITEEKTRLKQEEERKQNLQRKVKRNKCIIITMIIIILCVACGFFIHYYIKPYYGYNKAVHLMDNGKYQEACSILENLGDYKDSKDLIIESKYSHALSLIDSGKHEEAYSILIKLGNYKDSITLVHEYITLVHEYKYNKAIALYNAKEFTQAYKMFSDLVGYKEANSFKQKTLKEIVNILRFNITAGYMHSVAIKSDGTVIAIGDNEYNQCNVDSWRNIVAISAGGYHTVGLKSNGTVVITGGFGMSSPISYWNDITAISAGALHTIGLKIDGTVVAAGDNEHGQCNVSSWSNIVAISAGETHTVGLKSDGTVIASGDNKYGQCNVDTWSDIIAVSAGWYHTIGLKSDGTVIATGGNEYGQCNVGSWINIVAISAGPVSTVAIKSDGKVVAIGDNSKGRINVSSWNDIYAISAGVNHTIGLKSDGTVIATGENEKGQCAVSSFKDIKTVR
jgi:tetratricopeptide (TPR) repeat protein